MIIKLRDNEKNARENKTPEHKLEYWRQWRKNNPEKVKAAQEKFTLDKTRRNTIAKKYRENNYKLKSNKVNFDFFTIFFVIELQ